jgi:hypothetical protein
MEYGGLRRQDRAEGESRNDTEVAAAGPAKCAEQVLVLVLVAFDNTTVGQHDLRRDQVVAGRRRPGDVRRL